MSSRFYQQLILGTDMFADIDASVMGSRDPGLFYVRARLADGVDFDTASAAIDKELKRLIDDGVTQHEIDKCVNKYLSNKLFENVGYAEKAVALCSHELLWGTDGINTENDAYRHVTPQDIAAVAANLFEPRNCNTVYYGPSA